MRKCKVCRTAYTPTKPMQTVCSHECAMSLAVSVRGKAEKVARVQERKADAAKRDKLKSKAAHAKEAQSAFNAWVRQRDHDQPCISCGRHHTGQYHAGHFLSVGARPELRFTESNVHKQCAPCNTHLSGNAVLFRRGLVAKLGLELVEWLEGPHEPRRDTVDSLKAIKAHYTTLTKQLREIHA